MISAPRRKAKSGLERTTQSLIDYLLERVQGFYGLWLGLPPLRKEKIARDIRKIIQLELLDDAFFFALGQDILKADSVEVDSAVFQYLKRRLFHGDTLQLLKYLQEIKEKSTL